MRARISSASHGVRRTSSAPWSSALTFTCTVAVSDCTKVSPASDYCYAEAQEDARYGRVEWGGPRVRTREVTRRAPHRWDREAAAAGDRRRVFCMSLGDFWDNQVPVHGAS